VRNAPWPRKPERCLRPLVGLPVVPSGPFTARDDGDERHFRRGLPPPPIRGRPCGRGGRFRTYLPLRGPFLPRREETFRSA